MPLVMGEILTERSRGPVQIEAKTAPRWSRTGEGRRANQHTRIDIDDYGWRALHEAATRGNHTISRWVGLQVEEWALARSAVQT
jgi:hypothetical protein